ncbi:hypothetical protein LCGC14_0428850 [marine sediment metagenome]|uniref:Uncharacterized protein n=1 Tax=marine sediment metagenome TaxID=412755 RepID=A0A0F9T6Q7_9ZZZZ
MSHDTTNRMAPRKFNLSERVQIKIKSNRGRTSGIYVGTIIGYEDGNNLGRYSPKCDGWVYHVALDVDDERVLVAEENCNKL